MRDRMNTGHAVGQRGTFLSSFLNSAGMKTSESVAFSMSDSSVIQYTDKVLDQGYTKEFKMSERKKKQANKQTKN